MEPENEKPEWLEHLSVLRLEPGDTLVFRTRDMPSSDQIAQFSRTVEREFPGHKCIVLTDGMEIGVVREGEA